MDDNTPKPKIEYSEFKRILEAQRAGNKTAEAIETSSKKLNDLGLNINEDLIDIEFNLYVTKIDCSLDSDTYCFNDYKNHTGIFNGIYTGNCSEIIEYTSPNEVAVCNLASISLPNFVNNDLTFDYEKLIEITKVITRNLNKVIDINYYPVDEAKNSNLHHRPIGIGI